LKKTELKNNNSKVSIDPFEYLYEKSPVAFQSLNGEGRIINVNETWLKMMQYRRDEVLGRKFKEFLLPEHSPIFETNFEQFKTKGEMNGVNYTLLDAKENKVSVIVNGRIEHLSDNNLQTHCVLIDVTEYKKNEHERYKSDLKYQTLFESASDAIFLMSGDRFIDCNPKTLEIFGCRREQIINQPPYRFSPEMQPDGRPSRDSALEKINTALSGKSILFEWLHCKHDGTPFDAEVNLSKIVLDNVPYIQAIVRDITDRKRVEKISSALLEISESSNQTSNLEELLAVIHKQIGDLIDVTNFYVAVYDADNNSYSFPYWIDQYDGVNWSKIDMKKSLTDYVRRTGRPLLADKEVVKKLEDSGEIVIIGEPSAIWLGVPLNTSEGIYGVMVVQSYFTSGLYSEKDVELLSFISSHIAMLIQKKRAEEALRKSENKSQSILKAAPIGIGLVKNSTFTWVSDQMVEITGYSKEELIGKDSCVIYESDEEYERVGKVKYADIEKYGTGEVITRWKRKDGTLLDIHLRSTPIDPQNISEGVTFSAIDITEMRKLQEQANRAQRLETAGKIAGQVAHDFNNMLGPLLAYPEMIRIEISDQDKVKEYLEVMEQAAKQMAEINDQLLTLGRRGHYNLKPFNINEILEKMLNQIFLDSVSHSIETDFADDIKNILGGKSQIFRIFSNLILNARDAIQNDGILSITTRNVHLESPSGKDKQIQKGDYVKVTIKDNGDGIPDEYLSRIFDPFFSTKQTNGNKGSGLGLSIVHAIMEDHNGYIDLESSIGVGTEFNLYFPITEQEDINNQQRDIIGGNEKIMVVDDDPIQREVVKTMLTKLGYKITTAQSGEQALELLKSEQYDLLFLDMIMLGGIDGTETFRRSLEIHPKQKAVILSGFAETERVTEALEMGAIDFLKKPLTLASIAAAVRNSLEKKHSLVTIS